MTEEVYLAFAVLVVAALAVEGLRWFRAPERQALRRFGKTPVTPVGRCVEGAAVRVEGVTESLDRTLRAPVSGDDCVVFQLTVVRSGLGDQSEPRRVLFEHRESVLFALRDGSARAHVHPADRSTLVTGRARLRRCTFGDAPESVRAIMTRYRIDRAEVGGPSAPLELYEIALAAGDRVAVGGTARWEPDANAGPGDGGQGAAFREAPHRLNLRPDPAGYVVIAPAPRA